MVSGVSGCRRHTMFPPPAVIIRPTHRAQYDGLRARLRRVPSRSGWKQELGPVRARCVRSVRKFIEKPDAATARKTLARGGLWNSFVMTAQVESIYQTVTPANFSSGLLQRMPESVAVMEMKDVLWSDWGQPERIAESIRSIGLTPAFPESNQPAVARSTFHSAKWEGRPDLTRVARSPGRSSNLSATAPLGVV